MDQTLQPRIRAWLDKLATLTRSGADGVSAETINDCAHLLGMDNFPSGAFTMGSLHHCAQGHRFFPAYDDIRKALHGWWDANRQDDQRALPGVAGASDLTAMDRSWLAFWHKRREELVAGKGSMEADRAALANLASLVRAQSPKAWAAINGREPELPRQPTDAAVEYVTGLLRPGHDARSAPDVLEGEVLPPFRDVTAHGDQLAAVRARAGVRTVGA